MEEQGREGKEEIKTTRERERETWFCIRDVASDAWLITTKTRLR